MTVEFNVGFYLKRDLVLEASRRLLSHLRERSALLSGLIMAIVIPLRSELTLSR
jgi:hypothetical protein